MSDDEFVILAVDDDAGILALLEVMLEKSFPNSVILTATSPAEARSLIGKGGVDVILSDYKMPGENGVDYLSSAVKDSPGTSTVLISAYGDDLKQNGKLPENVDAFFSKPLDMKALVAHLKKVLATRKG